MTIEEIRLKKDRLSGDVTKLIQEFQDHTGVRVDSLEYVTHKVPFYSGDYVGIELSEVSIKLEDL